MVSVTKRIELIKQPRGGYIPTKSFSSIKLETVNELAESENIPPNLIGITVDYLTRLMLNPDAGAKEAFKISLMGASRANKLMIAKVLVDQIHDLDDQSIAAAINLVKYDSVLRAGFIPEDTMLVPNDDTLHNIKQMVIRSLNFFDEYGPMTLDSFTFPGGYTDKITSGDGDFLTADTLWDFKVLKANIKPQHTLQLLVYYLMGINSIHDEFQSLKKLGIFNPRLNTVYLLEIETIPKEVIMAVNQEVIGY
jgi:hypothetical protein